MIKPEIPATMNMSIQYKSDPNYDFISKMVNINFEEEREKDIKSGKGFIIKAPKGIKKDIKLQDGIFSSRYGSNSLTDADSYSGKYRCKCGHKRGSMYNGEVCEICGSRVTHIGEDVSITGYLKLKDNYWIIHPNFYMQLDRLIGSKRLLNIIDPIVEVDSDGIEIPLVPMKKDEPFKGIGLMEFHDRFDEVIDFYYNKYPNRKEYYDFIVANKDTVWTHTISVFSSLLRPSSLDNGTLKYEECNEYFSLLSSLVYKCNDDKLMIDQKKKERLTLLYDIQYNLNTVYNKIKEMLSKKTGDIRSCIGGRYIFSARSVIRQDVSLKPDEIKLPFAALCELMQQIIINILVKTYNFSYSTAQKKWYKAQIKGYDKIIYDIIEGYINYNDGLPCIINRNPTIQYGSVLFARCIGINMDYTMSISLLVLKPLAADFDGDTLNIMYLYNQDFIRLAERILSAKYMFISKDTGECNADMLHSRDTIINANSLKGLYQYSPDQIERIKMLQNMA